MNIDGKHYRTIWLKDGDPTVVQIIDQRHLPHRFVLEDLTTVDDVAKAIREMHLRGAGLIGVAAGFGMQLAAQHASRESLSAFMTSVVADADKLMATRPTAVNLQWAVKRQLDALHSAGERIGDRIQAVVVTAQRIADEDAEWCRRIGEHGVVLLEEINQQSGGNRVNILTHCNAGWLAFVDWGSAMAPIYAAHDQGIPVHVWVDETRPRNQGARLTAWELGQHGVPHTIIVDNVGGHLMQHGQVDLFITGADRTTYTGDVANKIGTYLKALAAFDNGVPYYVAMPSSSIDWEIDDGRTIPIEQRDATEVQTIGGLLGEEIVSVRLAPDGSPAANYAFDVTPRRLVTGLITERGICKASAESVLELFPEKRTDRRCRQGTSHA